MIKECEFMDSVTVKPCKLKGKIRPPNSKSYTHRALCLGLLSQSPTLIVNPLFSRDTRATLTSCVNFGAEILDLDSAVELKPPSVLLNPEKLNVENSGTTLRFLTSISALVPQGEVILNGDDSIQKRPMKPLLNSLNDLGVSCSSVNVDGTPPIIVKGGGIKGGHTEMSGSILNILLFRVTNPLNLLIIKRVESIYGSDTIGSSNLTLVSVSALEHEINKDDIN